MVWFSRKIRIKCHSSRSRPLAVLSGLEDDRISPVRHEITRQVGDMEKTLNAVLTTDESVAFAV
jgi:hypothetical protein